MTTTRIKAQDFPDLDDERLYPRLSDEKMAFLAGKGDRRSSARSGKSGALIRVVVTGQR